MYTREFEVWLVVLLIVSRELSREIFHLSDVFADLAVNDLFVGSKEPVYDESTIGSAEESNEETSRNLYPVQTCDVL